MEVEIIGDGPSWAHQQEHTVGRLIEMAGQGDASAFEALMRRHERQVFGTALHLTGNRDDARTVTQEVFIRMHRSLRELDTARDPGPWLGRVTVNLCRDLFRRRRKEPHLPVEEWSAAGEPDRKTSTEDPEEHLERSEALRRVAEGLQSLPEKERTVVVLRDVQGFSAEETARLLGTAASTVRVQLSSARLKLRAHLERCLGRRK